MSKHLVRVRALSNVMGLHYGDVAEVVATPRVEILIRGGHLEWVDEAGAKVVEPATPVEAYIEGWPTAGLEEFAGSAITLDIDPSVIEDVTLEEAAAEVKKVRKLRSVKAADDAE